MPEITNQPLTPENMNGIRDLFEKAFNKPLNLPFYNWRFLENPFGPVMVLLALDGNRIAAHYALCPSVSRSPGGELVQTAQSMTTMTDPDYGGMGLFPSLAEDLYARVSESHRVEIVHGFPNANSHYSFKEKLGWSDIQSMFFLARDLDCGNHQEFEVLQLEDVTSVLEVHQLSLTGWQPYHRSMSFLKWRYVDNPVTSYSFVAPAGRNVPVVLVVKIYREAPGNCSLDIIDILGDHNRAALEAAIDAACGFAGAQAITRVQTWIDTFHPAFSAFERRRFRPTGPITYFGARAFSPRDSSCFDPREWRITMGDSDVF